MKEFNSIGSRRMMKWDGIIADMGKSGNQIKNPSEVDNSIHGQANSGLI